MTSSRHNALTDWAFEILSQSLERQGETIRSVGFPDRTERSSRAVDVEVEVTGRRVGVEVTQCARGYGLRTPARKLLELVADLHEQANGALLGHLVVDASFRGPPPKSRTRALAEAIEERIRTLAMSNRSLGDIGAISTAGLDPARHLGVSRIANQPEHLTWILSVDGTGGSTLGLAAQFVDQLISRKSTQGRKWRELWLLIVDLDMVADAEDVEQALRDRRADLPDNWRRFFWIPATDRSSTIELHP